MVTGFQGLSAGKRRPGPTSEECSLAAAPGLLALSEPLPAAVEEWHGLCPCIWDRSREGATSAATSTVACYHPLGHMREVEEEQRQVWTQVGEIGETLKARAAAPSAMLSRSDRIRMDSFRVKPQFARGGVRRPRPQ